MTAKTILALAQTHRKEPSRENYDAMASAVRALVAERDALAAQQPDPATEWLTCPVCNVKSPFSRIKMGTLVDEVARVHAVATAALSTSPPKATPSLQRPQNCGTGYCSCIECVAPKVTVLPYMGPPVDPPKKPYKAPYLLSDGVIRTPERIQQEQEDF